MIRPAFRSVRRRGLLAAASLLILSSYAMVAAMATPGVVDRAQDAGVAVTQRTWSVSTVDYNADGLEDFLVVFHQAASGRLMRNNGDGTYTRVAHQAWARRNQLGGVVDRHDCAWADVDHNGLPDAYCSAGRNESDRVKVAKWDNELWMQLTPGRFTDVGTDWGVGDACGRGRYVAFLDVNNDGWQDLFLGNDAPRADDSDPCDDPDSGLPNEESKIFLNQAGQGLTYAPEWDVSQPYSGNGCALPLDYNRDGLIDLLACHLHQVEPYLYLNTGTGFVESRDRVRLSPITSATLGDLNLDGVPDLVTSGDKGFDYRLGKEAGGFTAPVRIAGVARHTTGWDVAVGDVDGDGTQDVYALVASRLVYVEDGGMTNPDDTLYLNRGLQFTPLAVPPAGGGASAVAALQPTPGAAMQFLVLNGVSTYAGPIQLLSYTP